MLTWETTVEAQALYARGWTKSAIARHLGINRRTVREYLKGQQVPGQRVRSEPEVFAPFAEYARRRLDPAPAPPLPAQARPQGGQEPAVVGRQSSFLLSRPQAAPPTNRPDGSPSRFATQARDASWVLTTSIRPPAPPASRLGRLRAQAARPRPARRSRPAAAVGRALRCVSHWTPSSPRRDCTCPATTP